MLGILVILTTAYPLCTKVITMTHGCWSEHTPISPIPPSSVPQCTKYAGLLYLTSQSQNAEILTMSKKVQNNLTLKRHNYIFACRDTTKNALNIIFTVRTCVALEILHVQDGQEIFFLNSTIKCKCTFFAILQGILY